MTHKITVREEVTGVALHPSMNHHERRRLRDAARRARQVYPGPVGELISGELLAWEKFGYRLGSKQLIMGIVEVVMNARLEQPDAA